MTKLTATCLAAALLFSITAGAASVETPEYPKVWDAREQRLQQQLNGVIRQLKLTRAVEKRQLSVTLLDLANVRQPRMAGVNGDVMFYSASLPKICILMGAFARIQDGKLKMTPALRKDLADMIRSSSNPAATRVLDQVGRNYLIDLLTSERYALYDKKRGGGLWVGKPYGSEGAYRRDPLHGFSHGATSIQAARFYYLMETGRLVSPKASREMKELMGEPAVRHKFVKALADKFPKVKMFRKSGTWRNFHSDSAIVQHDGKHYILVALSNDERGGKWLEDIAVAVDAIIPAAPPRRAPVRGKEPAT